MNDRLLPALVLCLACLLLASSATADRPAKKMIPAVTAIDVGSGVEKLMYKASLPWMICQALVVEGVKTNYADFCAISGWSAEFHYDFDKQQVAFLSLQALPSGRCFSRGVSLYGKHLEMFPALPCKKEEERLGAARMAWEFICTGIAGGKPVLTDYLDGGLFYGYDETLEDPALYFNTNGPGFGALKQSKFNELFHKGLFDLGTIADGDPGPDAKSLLVATLANLLVVAAEPESDGASAGIAGMKKLADDLLDPARDWTKAGDWLCWPLSEQTETRLCTAVYLRRNAELLGDAAKPHLLQAADRYEEAFGLWRKRWDADWLTDGKKDERPARLAEPARLEATAGYVDQALGAELLALSEVRQALDTQKDAGK